MMYSRRIRRPAAGVVEDFVLSTKRLFEARTYNNKKNPSCNTPVLWTSRKKIQKILSVVYKYSHRPEKYHNIDSDVGDLESYIHRMAKPQNSGLISFSRFTVQTEQHSSPGFNASTKKSSSYKINFLFKLEEIKRRND